MLLLGLMGLGGKLSAAPTYDSNFAAFLGASSATGNFTVSAGSNKILIVWVQYDQSAGVTSNTVTYNGLAMTLLKADPDNATFPGVFTYYLLNPPTGASYPIVTTASPAYAGWRSAGAYSYSGVNQVSPFGAAAASWRGVDAAAPYSTGVMSFTPISTLSTVVIQDFWQGAAGTGYATNVGTTRYSDGPGGSVWHSRGLSDWNPAVAAATTITETWTTGGTNFTDQAFELMPAGATATTYNAACGSATIDGALTDSVWASQGYEAMSVCGGTCGLLGTQGAQFKVSWDATYLYIAADVNDPFVSKSQTNPWERSAVEVWFDMNNAGGGGANSMQADDWQFIFNYDGSAWSAYRNGGAIGVPAGISATGATRTGGYTFEARFTWASINGVAPTPGTTFAGLNVQVDFPASVGTARDRWVSWTTSNNDPTSWNTLGYTACPGTATFTYTASPTPTITMTPTPMACSTPVCSGSWTIIGNGSVISSGYIQLTSDTLWQSTAMWSNFKLDLAQSWTAQYDLYFGNKDAGGADGIVFLMHNDPRGLAAIGDNGQGISYSSVGTSNGVSPSVAVEWDTWQNVAPPDVINFNDPVNDHTSIHISGNADEGSTPLVAVNASSSSANIEDGLWHRVNLVWTYNNATSQTLSTYFDGVLRQTYTANIINTIFAGQTCVFWGFTSGTGGSSNLQEVQEVSCDTPTPTPTPSTAAGSPTFTRTITMTRTRTITPSVTPSVTPTFSVTNSPVPAITSTFTPSMPLVKTSNLATATLGDTVTFCVSWTNNSGASTSMVVWDTIAASLSYIGCNGGCSRTGSLVTWTNTVASYASGSGCFWGTVSSYPP